MLNSIIRFSLRYRPVVLCVALVLLVVGSWTAWRMEVDVFPDLGAPTVVVMTEAGSMAPEEVERLVTFPIETAVNGATGVRRVRSSSTTGFSAVWVEFDWGTDIYQARQTVSEKLSAIEMPQGAGQPTMGPQSSILGEVLFIGLTADSTSLQDLRTMADWTIRPQLLQTGGVAQVAVIGGEVREFQIVIDPLRLRHYGVTVAEVVEATSGMNQNVGGGVFYQHGNEYIVRGMMQTSDVELLRRAVVRSGMTLDQVADVRVGDKRPQTGLASIDGRHGVLMTVTKQHAVNTRELTEQLDATMQAIASTLPRDVKVHTQLYRQQTFIDASISNIQHSLIEGALFVVLVLFVFLANARTTIISLVTIPLALLVTIIVLHAMGLTMNTMSIGGMAIAIGSLVDDAIVDVENVWHRLHQVPRRPIVEVVFHASREVRKPILSSTLIIVVSFVPLFFLSGMEGRMLAPLGVAFIVSLFASTFVALTLTPVLCSLLLTPPQPSPTGEGDSQSPLEGEFNPQSNTNNNTPSPVGEGRGGVSEPRLVLAMKRCYRNTLTAALRHSRAVLAATGVSLVAALAAFFSLGHSFLPPFNEGSFTVNVSSMPGISIEESDRVGRQAEMLLKDIPEITAVARKTGRAELDEHALGVNTSEIEAPFVLQDRSKDELLEDVRHRLSSIRGVNVEVGQPISHRLDAMLSGTQAGIAIKVFGPDLNRLHDIGLEIKEAIEDIEGVADLSVEQQVERPQLKIEPRREMLAAYGITLPQFAQAVNVMLSGEVVSQVQEDGRIFDLTVKAEQMTHEEIEDLPIVLDFSQAEPATLDYSATPTMNSVLGPTSIVQRPRAVALGDIADVRFSAGPGTINRENVQRKIVVSANAHGRDMGSVVTDIQEAVAEHVELPEGYRVEYGGQFESEASASRTLLMTSVLSILVIFLLLYGQFRNARQSALVLLNLPLALIGGVLALWLTGGVLSIPAIIGFISLFGIATRNGMLLIDRYNDLRSQGLTIEEAVIRGSIDRLNPIIMTALTSALALVPLALGSSLPGNEIQSPMAQVMLGGLLTSTLLNAFVIPIMYSRNTK